MFRCSLISPAKVQVLLNLLLLFRVLAHGMQQCILVLPSPVLAARNRGSTLTQSDKRGCGLVH